MTINYGEWWILCYLYIDVTLHCNPACDNNEMNGEFSLENRKCQTIIRLSAQSES